MKGFSIVRVDGEVESVIEVTELPIRWVPEYDPLDETYGENVTQWSMFIPHVVDGQEIGGVSLDIVVTRDGLLTGRGPPMKFRTMKFDTPEEAKRYAETTFNLQDNDDDT